jgi:hypothetical protein
VEALAVCRVGGGAGKAASPKGPRRVAGGSGRAGAAASGVVAKSTVKGELAGQALGSDWRVQYGDRGWAGGQHRACGDMSSVVVNGKCMGFRAAAKEHDIVARKSSADGPVGRWLMNMKISELKLGRLGEARPEKVSLVEGIAGSLLPSSRHRASRGGEAGPGPPGPVAGHAPVVSHGSLRPLSEWSGGLG